MRAVFYTHQHIIHNHWHCNGCMSSIELLQIKRDYSSITADCCSMIIFISIYILICVQASSISCTFWMLWPGIGERLCISHMMDCKCSKHIINYYWETIDINIYRYRYKYGYGYRCRCRCRCRYVNMFFWRYSSHRAAYFFRHSRHDPLTFDNFGDHQPSSSELLPPGGLWQHCGTVYC